MVMLQKMLPARSSDILTDQSFVLHISIPMFNTPFKLITAAPRQREHILNALLHENKVFA
jgi:hypothetical protein